MKLDRRRRDSEKEKSIAVVTHVVNHVAALSGVEWKELMERRRGRPVVASSRSMAMAACVTLGVPICHVARAFNRESKVVYVACEISRRRCANSASFRDHWNDITQALS